MRVDSGFGAGAKISVHYDPMISKLITYADDRQSAINRMLRALSEYHIAGIVNNIPFLKTILDDIRFRKGKIDINFVERNLIELIKKEHDQSDIEDAASLVSVLLKRKLNPAVLDLNRQSFNRWGDYTD